MERRFGITKLYVLPSLFLMQTLYDSALSNFGLLFGDVIEPQLDDEIRLNVSGEVFLDVLSFIENQVWNNTHRDIVMNTSIHIQKEWHNELYGYNF